MNLYFRLYFAGIITVKLGFSAKNERLLHVRYSTLIDAHYASLLYAKSDTTSLDDEATENDDVARLERNEIVEAAIREVRVAILL
jgi:hypothetical protein